MRVVPIFRILWVVVLVAFLPAVACPQAQSEIALGETLVHEYETEVGLKSTPELDRISSYVSSVGNRVASALPSHRRYHFILDPNPGFKSAFALSGGYIIVGGGLLAITQTEDELANALAHEIEHVELGQVDARVAALAKEKGAQNLRVSDFFRSYTKQQELACDLNGQRLAAKAGYSPAGMLTLLETFKAIRKGQAELPSDKHPTLSERIAQAKNLAKATTRAQIPLRIP
jgi:predicted Zn-dependent protease